MPSLASELERLATPVNSVYLQNSFVTERGEQYLLSRVRSQSVTKWKTLSGRRLQTWGGQPHDKGMILEPIPDFLQEQLDRLEGACADFVKVPMNHVLVNEYAPGQGIMAHQDGPLYHPCVAIISLGAPTVFRFTPHVSTAATTATEEGENLANCEAREFAVWLPPRSLLLFREDVYERYLHGKALRRLVRQARAPSINSTS